MDIWLAAGVLLSLTLAEGQTISGPNTIGIGQDLTLSCNYVPGGATIETYQWLFTGAIAGLKLFDDCTLFGEGDLAGYSYTNLCNGNDFSLTLQTVTQDTLSKEWCCNVGLVGGGAGTASCKTVGIDANCGNPTTPTNGQVSVTTTTYQSTATYSCKTGYTLIGTATTTCQADGTWSGSVRTCKAPVPCLCFCQSGCTAGLIIGIIFALSWIFAIVVVCVIYKEDQKRLPWNLCDGHLKNWQIWLLLFIWVPIVPSVVAIYLFKTKRPDKPPVGTELDKNGPKRPLPQIQPKNPSDPEKGSPRKLPEPPNPEEGFQSNRLSPLESNKLSNITETQQANGEQEKTKKKKKKKKKPKNNQVSDEEKEKSS